MVIATAANSSPLNQFFPIIIVVALFALMYFFMIRPQSKRRKEAMEMQRTLGIGSDVVTIGGLYGTVVETDDESVTLEIDEGVTARYTRQAIARVLPPPAETAPAADSDADDSSDADDANDADETPATTAKAEEQPAADDKDERPSDALSATGGDGTQAPKLSKES